jgi:hypothetical protein
MKPKGFFRLGRFNYFPEIDARSVRPRGLMVEQMFARGLGASMIARTYLSTLFIYLFTYLKEIDACAPFCRTLAPRFMATRVPS